MTAIAGRTTYRDLTSLAARQVATAATSLTGERFADAASARANLEAYWRLRGAIHGRAWQLVEAKNRAFRRPRVATAAGGSGGGGAQMTDDGRELLEIYRRLQAAVTETAAAFEAEFQAHLK